MFLVDTNVFLEILLKQEKRDICKKFLDDNIGSLNITDFSFHSIGVILFRYNEEGIFHRFVQDVIPNVNLLSLPLNKYEELIRIKNSYNLDFDDAYQYKTAQYYGLKVVTMDKDFQRTGDKERIIYL